MKKHLLSQMECPGQDLVRAIAGEVHEGRSTAQVRDMVAAAVKTAFKEIVRDAVQARLSSALENSRDLGPEASDNPEPAAAPDPDVVTTQEEIEGMMIVRAIVRDILDAKRIGLRDAKSYCAVLVDDNNRKPLARMHFNRKQWYLGLFDGDGEDRIAIDGLDDIYALADRLRAGAERFREA